jgi:hypothetical protein
MSMKIVKWGSIAALSALLLLAGLWRPSTDYRTLLAGLVVWAVAIAVLRQKPRLSIMSITEQNRRSESL